MTSANSEHPVPQSEPPSSERLDSWKEIAAYLKRDARTVQRWEKKEGLPIHRHLHDKLGSVYAYRSEIDAWWNQRRPGLETEKIEEVGDDNEQQDAAPAPVTPTIPQKQAPSRRDRILMGLFASAVVLLVIYVVARQIRPTARPPAGKIMLAVLPFHNLSGDDAGGAPGAGKIFCEGLTEEMITQLGRLHPQRLGVIARATVTDPDLAGKSVEYIGRTLNVQYVLEGSCRRAGNNVRISAQLIQVSDQTHVWSDNFDRPFEDVLAIQGEVAGSIATTLTLELLPAERARLNTPRTVNREAYEAYLTGRYFWNRREPQDLSKSLQYFKEAIAKDPNMAQAYAGVADAYNVLGFYSVLPSNQAYSESRTAARRAIELDGTLAEGHASLADMLYHYEYDWGGAQKEFERAIELNPSYATAHHWYAAFLTLQGKTDQGWKEIQLAQELDPLSLVINTDVALHRYYARQYDAAIEQCKKTLQLEPDFALAHFWLARGYVMKKMYPEAIAAFQKSMDLEPGNVLALALKGHAYAVSGQAGEARKVLAELQQLSAKRYVSPDLFALIYVGLGDNNQVMAYAEKAFRERAALLTRLKMEPILDPLRSDPRFRDLLRRAGLS